jgi:hypothetical protein
LFCRACREERIKYLIYHVGVNGVSPH